MVVPFCIKYSKRVPSGGHPARESHTERAHRVRSLHTGRLESGKTQQDVLLTDGELCNSTLGQAKISMKKERSARSQELVRAWELFKAQIPGTVEHKQSYDYKVATGYVGTSALERFKSHIPGTVEYRVKHPNHCGLEVSATGAMGPGADPCAGLSTASPQFRTGVGYGGHPAGGAAAGYPAPSYTRQGWRWDIPEEDMALAAMAEILHLWPDDSGQRARPGIAQERHPN